MRFLTTALILLTMRVTAAPSVPISGVSVNLDVSALLVEGEQLSRFVFYAQYAGASYCNTFKYHNASVACGNHVCPNATADKAYIYSTFHGVETDIRGFVGIDNVASNIIVSVRGSSSVRNWLTDFRFGKVSCDFFDGCEAHDGFVHALDEIKASVVLSVTAAAKHHPSHTLVVTGHSLGGAVATLLAAHLRRQGLAADLYTYGAPRVGTPALAEFLTAQAHDNGDGGPGAGTGPVAAGRNFRVTHYYDPVPRMPPLSFGYAHASPEYWLAAGPYSRVAYGVGDVRECLGILNASCNAGHWWVSSARAHGFYFETISKCSDESGGGVIMWAELEALDRDEEFRRKFAEYGRADERYARWTQGNATDGGFEEETEPE
ncbi:alpha/beta-hydrolase [Xylariaceae sp. FL0016]|nr:alpha/beta-hydrolase [Xylariaceae sp. FL0016]